MNSDNGFNKIQYVLLSIIAIAMIVILWIIIPITPVFIKIFLFIIISLIVFAVVFNFADSLHDIKKLSSTFAVISITALVFLAFPIANRVVYKNHEEAYLKSLEAKNTIDDESKITIRITYSYVCTNRSGSIGNEWTNEHFFNNKMISSGDTIIIDANKSFQITTRFTEKDDIDLNDVGETTSSSYSFIKNGSILDRITIPQKVHVEERGGRKNAGATIDFFVTYTLNRIIPQKDTPSVKFFDALLYTNNSFEYGLSIALIVGHVLSVLAIVVTIVYGNKKRSFLEKKEAQKKIEEDWNNKVQERKAREEEQKKIAEEERLRFEKEKTAFLTSLNGKSIRDVAGVPSSVRFINNLPKDNNNSLYGSFTVYYSSSGKCYHEKAGCCSARTPIHSFNAIKRYKPCSKCCKKQRTIPTWYNDYCELRRQANYYGIESIVDTANPEETHIKKQIDSVDKVPQTISNENQQTHTEESNPNMSTVPITLNPAQKTSDIESRATNHQNNETETIEVQKIENESIQLGIPGIEYNYSKKTDVLLLLKKHKVKYIDKRNLNGALWIIGGRELEPIVRECNECGVRFKFKENGGKQTGYKPGWWTK